jgi:DNA-binding winged helix-turn-helix (wHTH) protein
MIADTNSERSRPVHGCGTKCAVRFVIGDCVLDAERYVFERSGEPVQVQPQVFDVLAYLLEHRDRVVPKEELLDSSWGDRFVSESALTSRIKSARQLVGDDGTAQAAIRTVHGAATAGSLS